MNSGRQHGEQATLEFPAERVYDLLLELGSLVSDYLSELWIVALERASDCKEACQTEFLDACDAFRESLSSTLSWILEHLVRDSWKIAYRQAMEEYSRRNEASMTTKLWDLVWGFWILPFLEDTRRSILGLSVWRQGVLALVGLWTMHRLFFVVLRRRWLSKRQVRRRRGRRLQRKRGQSEILHGRTSLVYGAAGDLRDEEYLAITPKTKQQQQRRGRFGTFDFFGINNSSSPRKGSSDHRFRSQSSGDDPLFGSPRKRTLSTDTPAIVRPRNDSTGSFSDTFGGFMTSLRGHRQQQQYQQQYQSNRTVYDNQVTPIISNQTTATFTTPVKTLRNNRRNASSPRLRKERLGSMDVYYAPGKHQPTLTPHQCKAFQQEDFYDSKGKNPHTKAINDLHGSGIVVDDNDEHEDGGFRSVSAERYYYQQGDEYSAGSTAYPDDATGDATRYLYDEFGVVTLSHRVEYFGPFQPLLRCGSTLVPPLPFEVVSRRIDSTEIDLPLQRTLKLDLLEGRLHVIEPSTTKSQNKKWDIVYDTNEISIKANPPLEGGVLSIYHTNAHEQDWKEHTFDSTHAAAQFQLDLLAYQVLGKPLKHIFEALNLVHLGSLAYNGQELVLHDDIRERGDETKSSSKKRPVEATQCIAWDDAMRAMSSIPTVRIALERLWLSHRRPSRISSSFATVTDDKGGNNENKKKEAKLAALEEDSGDTKSLGLLKEEYIKHRLLLGPVDFFRLFVPTLPETAVPEGKSNNRGRMEQLLCWRKRVARASVLVRSYARARLVANKGWHLPALADNGGDHTITKRFASDGNENNNVRDTTAKNEIYEASVSRDVLCHVRPFDYLTKEAADDDDDDDDVSEKHLVLSPYQAYTYVDSHYFKAPDELLQEGGPLHPSRDPVEMFPSLKEIISKHSGLDFFVDCISDSEKKVMIIHLHVRSLAKGIDPQFDNVIERFSKSPEEHRNKKLYLMFQMGTSMGLSFLGWICLKLLSFYFRFTETGRDSPMNLETTRDRYGFPAFQVGGLFRTYHFGGSLQTDPEKPKNYIGLTKCIAASYQESFLGKILFAKLQNHFMESTVDFTFVIEGEKNDELPERALSTLRVVHVDSVKVAKDPRPFLVMVDEEDVDCEDNQAHIEKGPTLFSPQILQGAVRSLVHLGESSLQLLSPDNPNDNNGALEVITEVDENGYIEITPTHLKRNGNGLDYLEKGIDVVIDILRSVMVPSRHKPEDFDPNSFERWNEETEDTGLVVMSKIPALRMFDRNDIGRYIRHFDFDLKVAALQIAKTAAWRGQTFPVDIRRCRIELQNGQFFQQGLDKDCNPVFYFRNLCRGPWRRDAEAAIMAVLYRFDKRIKELCESNPNIRVTLIVLMGHAKRGARKKLRRGNNKNSHRTSTITIEDDYIIDEDQSEDESLPPERIFEVPSEDEIKVNSGNPRISPDEKWTRHTNQQMWEQLFRQFIWHYPGRFANIVMVKGRGRNHYYREHIQARMMVRRLIYEAGIEDYQQIMNKIRFVNKTSELTQYVRLQDLPTFVGGIAPIQESSYEFG